MIKRSKKNSILALGVWVIFIAVLAFFVLESTHMSSEAIEEYQRLKSRALQIKESSKLPADHSTQYRENVQKDLYYYRGAEPLHIQLKATDADLVIDKQGGPQYIESMNNVTCYIQEDLFYLLPDGQEATLQSEGRLLLRKKHPKDPEVSIELENSQVIPMQTIRYFEADHADYYYQTEHLVAQNVKVDRFIAAGHQVPSSLSEELRYSMTGIADSLELSLNGKDLDIIANQLKAVFLAPSFGLVAEEQVVAESTEAIYHDQELFLKGSVLLEHPIGTITANEVRLSSENAEKKFQFSRCHLDGNATLKLKDGGMLQCAKADLDYTQLKALLLSSPLQEYVTYQEMNNSPPVEIKSRQMQAVFGKTNNDIYLSKFRAEEDVSLRYGEELTTTCASAFYHRRDVFDADQSSKFVNGKINLFGSVSGEKCHVSNNIGDRILAHQIEIDPAAKTMQFHRANGTFLQKADMFNFSGENLTWDLSADLITLRGNVTIEQEGLGHLTTKDNIQFKLEDVQGKKQLQMMESQGETVLTLTEKDQKSTHTITCYGKVKMDRNALTILLESPTNAHGIVPKNKKVFLRDHLGRVYANRMILNYGYEGQKIIPIKVVLEGDVWMFNHSTHDAEVKKRVFQYAIADHVDYFFDQKEMKLSSYKGHRVLFYDKLNNLQVSAPALTIKRDEELKKDTVKGIGDVRFSFLDRELEKLSEFELDFK